jgi:hypothetical protein
MAANPELHYNIRPRPNHHRLEFMPTSNPRSRSTSRRGGTDRRASARSQGPTERRKNKNKGAYSGKDRRASADRRKTSRRSGKDRRDVT